MPTADYPVNDDSKDEVIKILQQQVQNLIMRMRVVEDELDTLKCQVPTSSAEEEQYDRKIPHRQKDNPFLSAANDAPDRTIDVRKNKRTDIIGDEEERGERIQDGFIDDIPFPTMNEQEKSQHESTGSITIISNNKSTSAISDQSPSTPCISLRNTETVHIYAIAAFADAIHESRTDNEDNQKRRKNIKSWIFAFISFLLTIIQLLVLGLVVYETALPTCSSHTSCPLGQFCISQVEVGNVFRQPRCLPCEWAHYIESLYNVTCDSLMVDPLWEYTDIDENILWFDKSGAVHYDESLIQSFGDGSEYSNQDVFRACLNKKYCDETMPYDSTNEDNTIVFGLHAYLDLLTSELSPDQIIILIFVAILFGAGIAQEITEASIEDTILSVVYNDAFASSIPLKLIRVSLRIRQLVLPWFVGCATISVMLTDSLSAKNVLLNFLAVCYLVESDNMLSKILFSAKDQEFVENVLFSNKRKYNGVKVSLLWPRIFALVISATTVLAVCYIKEITLRMKVSLLSDVVNLVLSYGFTFTYFLWILGHVFTNWRFNWESFLRILLEFSRSSCAFIICAICAIIPKFYIMYSQRALIQHTQVVGGVYLLLVFGFFWTGVDLNYRHQNDDHRCNLVWRGIVLTCFVIICFAFTLWLDLVYNLSYGILEGLGYAELILG